MTVPFLSYHDAMAGVANTAAAISAAEKRSSLLICVSLDLLWTKKCLETCGTDLTR
ncbi:hypothetical protein [Bradyrhizobium sp. NP1]|uniref:hypothetical protein n=1 Tax=Bradyrhizobium sp. NP1 TaxID=3049772 RepID=UPI0025A4EA59|nr:hypothetical protein [Bradyrhizobium sp. NP1]WJR75398.1 hypothetical protein QOU61_21625 [Bradyrhizobium sp. NP1]